MVAEEQASYGATKEYSYIPVLGKSAAGSPIEIIEYKQGKINTNGNHTNAFVIQVSGDSMMDAGISDGDYVVVKPQPEVENGEIALVEVEGSSTIKYFYVNDNIVELRPANTKMTSFIYDRNTAVRVKGKIVDIIKKATAEEAMMPIE
jgi:repressor LexA